jgi:hypothetical protein
VRGPSGEAIGESIRGRRLALRSWMLREVVRFAIRWTGDRFGVGAARLGGGPYCVLMREVGDGVEIWTETSGHRG